MQEKELAEIVCVCVCVCVCSRYTIRLRSVSSHCQSPFPQHEPFFSCAASFISLSLSLSVKSLVS